LAATLFALLAIPVAIAVANGSGRTSAAGRTSRQIKATAKQVKALGQQLAKFTKVRTELGEQASALEAKIAAIEGKQIPKSLPPSGPASGALTENYPNPGLGPDTVGTDNIRNGEVGTADITNGAVVSADIAPGTVGGVNLKNGITEVSSQPVNVDEGETKTATVSCPRNSRLLAGGWAWTHTGLIDAAILSSIPDSNDPDHTWRVEGRMDSTTHTGLANGLIAEALCLLE
jgi:hypothetical protein